MVKLLMAQTARAALRPLHLPPLHEATTDAGIRVRVMPRGPLPLVALRVVIQSGAACDPPGKAGLADFTARLLRRGTQTLGADPLNEAVEFVGGNLAAGAGEDFSSLAVVAPSEHLGAMLDIVGQMVREPSFPAAEVEMARKRLLAQLQNDLDDPGSVADRALTKAIWGGHPYGHDVGGTRADVSGFTRDNVRDFHHRHYGPKVTSLIVVGDVDPPEVMGHIERAFSGYSGGPAEPESFSDIEQPAMAGKVLLVDKADQTQTQVRFGGKGIPRGHPASFAITAFNTVLGGGFTSRLVTEVRVKRGLSYGAGSHFDSMRAGGAFVASTFTRTESSRQVVDVVLKEIARMRQTGPTPKELEVAKSFVAGLYPARLETNESLTSSLTDQLVYGIPREWVSEYRERLFAVTPKQAAEAARTFLFDDARALVLVGRAAEVEPQLKGLGEVEVWPVSRLE